MNSMLWQNGTQDSEQVDGVQALIRTSPTDGIVGGLAQTTYSWWRNRVSLNTAVSEANQTLCKTLRSEIRLLRRFGGRPNKLLAGSAFLEGLDSEVQAKGQYTVTGFDRGTDVGMADISMRGVGTFEYDPTLDDMGLSKYCYAFDSRRIKLRPMEGEDNKLVNPERPYNYFIFLKSMTWTGALTANQLNCHEIFSIA
jgi:hypothetical protein